MTKFRKMWQDSTGMPVQSATQYCPVCATHISLARSSCLMPAWMVCMQLLSADSQYDCSSVTCQIHEHANIIISHSNDVMQKPRPRLIRKS